MAALVFCCGAECLVDKVGASGGVNHWGTFGSEISVDTTIFHLADWVGGGAAASYRVNSAGTAARFLAHAIAGAPTTLVCRAYLYFGALPSANVPVLQAVVGGQSAAVRFDLATGKLLAVTSLGTVGTVGPVVVINQWYCVEYRLNSSANPWLLDFTVDGVFQEQISSALAAGGVSSVRFGSGGAVAVDIRYDDMAISTTAGDYPIGPGIVIGLEPNVDGTHSFTTNDFKYNDATGIASTATDVYTYLDDALNNITDWISQNVADAAKYVEVGFVNLPGGFTPQGIEVVSSHHASGANANNQSLKLNDGGTIDTVINAADLSQITIVYNSKHYALAPSTSAAWTEAKVNALKARWGYSTDVVDIPYIDGIRLEVAVIPTNFLEQVI